MRNSGKPEFQWFAVENAITQKSSSRPCLIIGTP